MERTIKKLFTLTAPSTSTLSGVKLVFPGDILELRFDYDRDGDIYNSAIRFNKVRAHQHFAEIYVPTWKIECCYDTLIELLDSPLVQELRSNAPDDLADSWVSNHYMIYFDSNGCFEVIAESWEVLPEEKGSWE